MKIPDNYQIIYEKVYIETPVDTDGDGKADLIAAYVARPVTEEKVPVVFVANPYLMGCNEEWYDLHDVDADLESLSDGNESPHPVPEISNFAEYIDSVCKKYEGAARQEIKGQAESAKIDNFPDFEAISDLYTYLNQKGYATVFSGGLGTLGSDGFTMSGSPEEAAAFRSVILWLTGDARAFTDKVSGIEIRAEWSNGRVAMSGKSYLGTLCYAVAATGVDGLKAIIPEAAISSWYEYYRHNGLCVAPYDWQGDDIDLLSLYCMSRAKDETDFRKIEAPYRDALQNMRTAADRVSGGYNFFWEERNYLKHASEFKAACFIIHGLHDLNVKPDQAIRMFRALSDAGKDCRMMLHRGEHIYIYDLEDSGCLDMVERWLDRYLKEDQNGAEEEPRVLVESNLDQSLWLREDSWPHRGTNRVTFVPSGQKKDITIIDDLDITEYNRETDDRKAWRDGLVLGEGELPYRKKFVLGPFEKDIRIAGETALSFRASLNERRGILSAMLVDLGEDERISSEEIRTEGSDGFTFGTAETCYEVITRGWMDPGNRESICYKKDITPGEFPDYRIGLMETEYILKEGHELGLILYGSDADFTIRQHRATEICFEAGSIELELPICD